MSNTKKSQSRLPPQRLPVEADHSKAKDAVAEILVSSVDVGFGWFSGSLFRVSDFRVLGPV